MIQIILYHFFFTRLQILAIQPEPSGVYGVLLEKCNPRKCVVRRRYNDNFAFFFMAAIINKIYNVSTDDAYACAAQAKL